MKVAKGSPGLTKVYVPTNTAKVAPKKTENQYVESAAPVPDVPTRDNANSTEISNVSDEGVYDFPLLYSILYLVPFYILSCSSQCLCYD